MTVTELISNVEKWAEDRSFYDPINGATFFSQTLKLYEEFGELCGNIAKGRDIKDDIGDNAVVLINMARLLGFSLNDVMPDEIEPLKPWGDYDTHIVAMASNDYPEVCFSSIVHKASFFLIFRRLETIANGAGATLVECLKLAYDEIKDRKGKMIKGVYIKEGDL